MFLGRKKHVYEEQEAYTQINLSKRCVSVVEGCNVYAPLLLPLLFIAYTLHS